MPSKKIGKYKLVLTELYNEYIHGLSNHTDYDINSHYLIIETFGGSSDNDSEDDSDDDSDDDTDDDSDDKYYNTKINIISKILKISRFYNRRYRKVKLEHSIILNYSNIIISKNYIKPEIAECIYLKNNEYVAILKTFWIRLIQRTWKRIFIERNNVILKRKMLSSLNYRQLHGRWPNHCNYLPSLYGMLKLN